MKLSEFITKVVETVRALDPDQYYPYWGYWHKPEHRNKCQACLAGAYAALRGWVESNQEIYDPTFHRFDNISPKQTKILEAINYVRQGHWKLAQASLGMEQRVESNMHGPPPLHTHFAGSDEFNAHLESLEQRAKYLESIGH